MLLLKPNFKQFDFFLGRSGWLSIQIVFGLDVYVCGNWTSEATFAGVVILCFYANNY